MNNNKILTTVMSVLLLLAVYFATCVYLPESAAAGNMTEARQTDDGNSVNEQKADNGAESYSDSININFADKVVVIDSGHGGIDPGKESADGILEKDINLAIAKVLKSKLENAGISVVMTRTDDNGLYSENDSNKKMADMKKRCAIIEECNADIVVSIHQNSFQSTSVKGAQMFYYKHSAEGKALAQIFQKTFKEYVDSTNQRVEKANDTYYMLLHTKAPTVIAECGFLSSPQEAALLNSAEYQEKIAAALYYGIIEYFSQGK